MKKTMCVLTAAIFLLGMVTSGYAATSATVSATAAVVSELTLTASVFQVDSRGTTDPSDDVFGTSPVTTMTFGNLTHLLSTGADAGLLYSTPFYYVALLGGFTSGRKYRIQSSCAGLVGPTRTLTQGFGVTNLDGDPKQANGTSINAAAMTGTLGTPGSATVINKVLYDSGAAGDSRVIRADFGIPPFSTAGTLPGDLQPIPESTPAGTYTGNVTFTIVLY